MAQSNIDKEADPSEKARLQRELTKIQLKTLSKSVPFEKATIVLRAEIISLYWKEQIRPENICKIVEEYCPLLYLPTLGAGVYDDTNFIVCAKKPSHKLEYGSYWFDENDIQPIGAKTLCDLLETPQRFTPFLKILSAEDGDEMAMLFENELGIEIYLNQELCEFKYELKYDWPGAVVYQMKE